MLTIHFRQLFPLKTFLTPKFIFLIIPALILGCVRWYYKYGTSYRDLGEMTAERGVDVDHTTLFPLS